MINLKKNDAIADAVRGIMEKELKGNQTKLDKNHNGKLDKQDFEILRGQKVKEGTDVNDRSEDTLAGRIKTKKKDDVGPGADFKSTKVDMKSEETVEENAFDYKSPRQPEPNGGSGVKKGSRYGGSKQKEKPEQEEPKEKKEEASYFKERLIERAMLKMAVKKAIKAVTGGSDEDQLKALQKRAGAPVTGKKPEPKNEEVKPPVHYGGKGTEGAKFDLYMQKRKQDNAKAAPKTQKEEVESIEEGLMTGITLAKKVKNDEGGHDQDVHHKGKKIGTISSYSHRTGTKYGMSHDASGDAMAGSRSHEEALSDLRQAHAEHLKSMKSEEVEQVVEKAPPGFEGTVKAMKKHKEVTNPFALAWSMKNKGYKSHKKADGSDK